MKTINAFLLTSAILLVSCEAMKWPTELFVKKNNYQEVPGYFEEPTTLVKDIHYAKYPDGLRGIYSHIVRNINYPTACKVKGIQGRVVLKYEVDIAGFVKNVEIVQSVDHHLDNEAVRIIKEMQRWIPGFKNGTPCKVTYTQPINFALN